MTKLVPVILSIFSHWITPPSVTRAPLLSLLWPPPLLRGCPSLLRWASCSMLAPPRSLMWLLSLSRLDSGPHARLWGSDSLARLLPCGVVRGQRLAPKPSITFALFAFWVLLSCITHSPSAGIFSLYSGTDALLHLSDPWTPTSLLQPHTDAFCVLTYFRALEANCSGREERREGEGHLVCNLTMCVWVITKCPSNSGVPWFHLGWRQILSPALIVLLCPLRLAVFGSCPCFCFRPLCSHLLPWLWMECPLFWCPKVFCPCLCYRQGLCLNHQMA